MCLQLYFGLFLWFELINWGVEFEFGRKNEITHGENWGKEVSERIRLKN
jgi:hypothetical protein